MKKASLLSSAILLAAAAPAAMAANSSILQVKGIIRPAACTPSLVGDGKIDYGDIGYKSLNATAATTLKSREIGFLINCDGPARVGLQATDNRSGSKVPGLNKSLPGTPVDAAMYGLGAVGKNNIGAFHLAIKDVQSGTTALDLLSQDRSTGNTWARHTTGNLRTDQRLTWALPNTVQPAEFTAISGTLSVTPVINRGDSLPNTQDIALDGAATLELSYL